MSVWTRRNHSWYLGALCSAIKEYGHSGTLVLHIVRVLRLHAVLAEVAEEVAHDSRPRPVGSIRLERHLKGRHGIMANGHNDVHA